MSILAIDPGCTESAYVVFDPPACLIDFDKLPNSDLMDLMDAMRRSRGIERLVIEQVACYGMAVGAEVFDTVFWSGRFAEAWERCGGSWVQLKRMDVKMHLCHSPRAKDGNIRQALIDRFGGESAIGRKKTPGPLYGVSKDVWAALAIAVTWSDRQAAGATPNYDGPQVTCSERPAAIATPVVSEAA